MAKIEMGILGGFSGRVGTVVGYHRRGAWFVRAYQPHIKDRKSAAQLEQRSRFKAMIQFASPATPVLRVGLRQVAADQQITEGNAFLKINKNHFRSSPKLGEVAARSADGGVCPANPDTHAPVAACGGATPSSLEGELRIDYSSLQFSRGSLAAPQALQYAVDEGGVLTVRWSAEGGILTDRMHIYIYSPAAQTGIALQGERAQRHLQALLPEGFAPEGLHVWAFASNASGNVSNTQYINPIDSTGEKNDIVNAEATHNAVPAAGPGSDCIQLAAPPSVAAAVGDG